MRTPRGLSLDLDDTLLDSRGIPESIARTSHAVAERFPDLDAEDLQRENETAWRTYWPQIERACWLGEAGGYEISRETWRRALGARGCRDEAVVAFAFETYERYVREATHLYGDGPPLLARAEAAGIDVVIVTNGASDLQRDKIEILGIENAAIKNIAIVISAEIGAAKPDPEIFYRAAAELGLPPATMWHVGDNLVTDVAGAKAAGMTAVWLNRDGRHRAANDPMPDLEVATLDQLLPEL